MLRENYSSVWHPKCRDYCWLPVIVHLYKYAKLGLSAVAAPSADQEAVERPPQLLALLLRTILTLRQALEAQLLSNCVSLAKYHLSPELNEVIASDYTWP